MDSFLTAVTDDRGTRARAVAAVRPTRVLFLEAGSGAGGSSTTLCYTLAQLDRSRFQPIVAFYFETSGPDVDRMKELGIRVCFLGGPHRNGRSAGKPERHTTSRIVREARAIGRLARKLLLVDSPHILAMLRLIRRENIDLVVLNTDVHYNLAGVVAARIAGLPCICRKAGGFGEGARLKKVLTPIVDCFAAQSQATAADQATNPATKRLEIIFPGIDLNLFSPRAASEQTRLSLGLRDDRPVVGYLSRFNPGKGQAEFLRAAAQVVSQFNEVTFLIVGDEAGDSGMLNQLKADVAQLRLTDHVVFAGWRRDTASVLACMSIFVHFPTTWIEGFGTAALEAMAMAKPVILARNGGLSEAIVDGESGIIVPVSDVDALAAAILNVLRDRSLAARLGHAARLRAEREFDAAIQTRRWEQLFAEYESRKRLS